MHRAVRDGKPFGHFLPKGMEPPPLVARVVPDPDADEYALEIGEDNAMVWCQVRRPASTTNRRVTTHP